MSDAGHHHDGPPGLPEIIDEAGDSSKWLPVLGIALFSLIAVVFVARTQMADEAPAAAEAPADDAPADAAPAADAPAVEVAPAH